MPFSISLIKQQLLFPYSRDFLYFTLDLQTFVYNCRHPASSIRSFIPYWKRSAFCKFFVIIPIRLIFLTTAGRRHLSGTLRWFFGVFILMECSLWERSWITMLIEACFTRNTNPWIWFVEYKLHRYQTCLCERQIHPVKIKTSIIKEQNPFIQKEQCSAGWWYTVTRVKNRTN